MAGSTPASPSAELMGDPAVLGLDPAPAAAACCTDGPAQAGAADASTPLGVQYSHPYGVSPATDAAGQATGGTTDPTRAYLS